MPKSVASPHAVNIEDLRIMARRRLPRMAFDYIDGGADREWTLRENCRAYEQVLFRPRSAVATKSCNLGTTVLGLNLDIPFLLGPVGSSRMFYPRGEERAASAAGAAGTIYTLSTLSGCRLEDVKAATAGDAWYQLYLVGGRDIAMGCDQSRQGRGLQGVGRHHRYAGCRTARTRLAQRRQRAARAQPVDRAVPRPDAGAAVVVVSRISMTAA